MRVGISDTRNKLQKAWDSLSNFYSTNSKKKTVDGTTNEIEIEKIRIIEDFLRDMESIIFLLNKEQTEIDEKKINDVLQLITNLTTHSSKIFDNFLKQSQKIITEKAKDIYGNGGEDINTIKNEIVNVMSFLVSAGESESISNIVDRSIEEIVGKYVNLVQEHARLIMKMENEKLFYKYIKPSDRLHTAQEFKARVLEIETNIKALEVDAKKAWNEYLKIDEIYHKKLEKLSQSEKEKNKLKSEIKELEQIFQQIDRLGKQEESFVRKLTPIGEAIRRIEEQLKNDKNLGEEGKSSKRSDEIRQDVCVENDLPKYFDFDGGNFSDEFLIKFLLDEGLLDEETKKQFQDVLNAFSSQRDKLNSDLKDTLGKYIEESKEFELWIKALENVKNDSRATKTFTEKLLEVFSKNKENKESKVDLVIADYNKEIGEIKGKLQEAEDAESKSGIKKKLQSLLALVFEPNLSDDQAAIIENGRKRITEVFNAEEKNDRKLLSFGDLDGNEIYDSISMQLKYAEWLLKQDVGAIATHVLNNFSHGKSRNRFVKAREALLAEKITKETVGEYETAKELYQKEFEEELNEVIKELQKAKESFKEREKDFCGEDRKFASHKKELERLKNIERNIMESNEYIERQRLELEGRLKGLNIDNADDYSKVLKTKREELKAQEVICEKQAGEVSDAKNEKDMCYRKYESYKNNLEWEKGCRTAMRSLLTQQGKIDLKSAEIKAQTSEMKTRIGLQTNNGENNNQFVKKFFGCNAHDKSTFVRDIGRILGFFLSFISRVSKRLKVRQADVLLEGIRVAKELGGCSNNFSTGVYDGFGLGCKTTNRVLNALGWNVGENRKPKNAASDSNLNAAVPVSSQVSVEKVENSDNGNKMRINGCS